MKELRLLNFKDCVPVIIKCVFVLRPGLMCHDHVKVLTQITFILNQITGRGSNQIDIVGEPRPMNQCWVEVCSSRKAGEMLSFTKIFNLKFEVVKEALSLTV